MTGMNLELSQKQTISQKMIQSMNILQMSAVELEQHIENMALENPVLEIQENPPASADDSDIYRQRKLEWLESTDSQNRVYYRDDSSDEREQDQWRDTRDSGESLSDYLLSQLVLHQYMPEEYKIIEHLIYSLDSKGYFTDDPKETARLFHVPEHTVLHLLGEIQELDPAGVGARDLQECLVKQLHRKENYSKITETIILFYLDELAKNHIPAIAEKMGITIDEVLAACEEIRSFNPKPGNSFSDREHLQYITPDALVISTGEGFDILINEYQYPRFTINTFYEDMAKTTDDKEAKAYLNDKIRQIKTLSTDIALRVSTLSKVMNILVQKQYSFFKEGPGHKSPLSLRDIADAAELHESTISRTLNSKYLQCSWGVFPLNYFLTQTAAVSGTSGEAQTQEQICQKMKEIIDGEDKKKPLSDEAIRKALEEADIHISRRTVNKYRGILGIPDKTGRKVY